MTGAATPPPVDFRLKNGGGEKSAPAAPVTPCRMKRVVETAETRRRRQRSPEGLSIVFAGMVGGVKQKINRLIAALACQPGSAWLYWDTTTCSVFDTGSTCGVPRRRYSTDQAFTGTGLPALVVVSSRCGVGGIDTLRSPRHLLLARMLLLQLARGGLPAGRIAFGGYHAGRLVLWRDTNVQHYVVHAWPWPLWF